MTQRRDNSEDLRLPLEDSPYLLDRHGPIFIVGCPRSGTTFLSRCIGSIEQIEQFVGVLVPPRMLHQIGMLGATNDALADDLLLIVRDILWQAFWRRIHFRGERAAQVVYRRKPWHWALRRPRIDGRYLCYKEPFLAFAVRELCRHFSTAKFIHIIRDGRDNADSLVRRYPDALSDRVLADRRLALNKASEIGVPRSFGDRQLPWWVEEGREAEFLNCSHFARYVWMWREMVTRVQEAGRQIGPTRYLELRYESVVAEPEQNARDILAFLGFEPSRRLLRQLRRGHGRSVGISRKNQSARNFDEANAVAGVLLHQLNYV